MTNDNVGIKPDALMQQVNDLELKYHDKQDAFWQCVFMGCTGFVAVVAPLSIQIDISRGVRWCFFGAVASAALCALCLIPLLYNSVRWHRELFEHGRKVARGESNILDFSPADVTRWERRFMAVAFVSIAVALACLVATCLLSI